MISFGCGVVVRVVVGVRCGNVGDVVGVSCDVDLFGVKFGQNIQESYNIVV